MTPRPLISRATTLLMCFFCFTGCIRQSFYLQQVEMTGPLSPPPVHISDREQAGEIRVSPRFSYSEDTHIQGQFVNTEKRITDPQMSAARIGNVNWVLPRLNVGTDVQYFVSDHVALASGITYAGVGGSSFWEAHLGLGLSTTSENLAARIDGGIQFRSFRYDAQVLVATDSDPFSNDVDVSALKDVWRESQAGFYGGLTLNTCYETSPVNGFLNFSLAHHSFGDLREMRRGLNGEPVHAGFTNVPATGLWMLSFSPGLSFSVSRQERILVGARFITGSELEKPTPEFLLVPFIQFDLSF